MCSQLDLKLISLAIVAARIFSLITIITVCLSVCLTVPAEIANGYPCFVISISMIGVCTAVIGDVAGHLGCFIYLKDSVNAIAFVALGTSVPGL